MVCWLGFQAFENMGMATGIMPVAGLPLPFLSYGGSAMVANLVAIGLLLNVDAQRRNPVGPRHDATDAAPIPRPPTALS